MTVTGILAPEELTDRIDPSELTISADGRYVAFTAEPVGRVKKERVSAIWLSSNGQPARQFTSGLVEDCEAAFSPDSTRLAFLSDRHERESKRLYVLPLNGGEATRLGTAEGELSEPRWSPDGRFVAVLIEDPKTALEKKQEEELNNPIVADQNEKRTRLFVTEVESGVTRQLTFGTHNIVSYAWNVSGTRLIVVSTTRTDAEGEMHPSLVATIAVQGGRLQTIATVMPAPARMTPVDLGDGEDAWVGITNGWTHDPAESVHLYRASGEIREVLTDDHGNVEGTSAIPGSGSAGIRIVEGVHANAYVLDVATGERTAWLPESWQNRGSINFGPYFSADTKTMAMVWSDPQHAEDVYVAKAGQEPVQISFFGKTFEGRLSKSETVEWESDGWTIQGVLFYPRDYQEGTRYPLLIEAHGGPSWQWEDRAFLNWHDWASFMADRGYAVLAPNPRGSTGRGKDFQYALYGDVGGGEVRDLINGAQAMVARGIADAGRLGIGGWSWGGYLTATTITKTTIFKAAMMGAGLSNL
ncbi:MAG TPA: prolyl oligopeptidase family serine peptidase, partial [Thermomicrobiales bacterium]|nr:prolyl oligopeptidase family serine peptidase [Thermomicrobiales bacterium]